MIDAKFLIDISTVPCVLSRSKYKNYLRLHLKFIEQYRWWCLSLLFLPKKESCVSFWTCHCNQSPCRALRRWRDHENRWAAKSRLMRDLNRRPGGGLQASTGPPSGLRLNPSGFRRRTGHETAPPSRRFTKGLECLEGLECLVPTFYHS